MWSSLELYDDGYPPWDQPDAKPDPYEAEIEELMYGNAEPSGNGPEPLVLGHPNIMAIGEPTPGSWGGNSSPTASLMWEKLGPRQDSAGG